MKRQNALILFTVLMLVVLILDRITKIIAIDVLTDSGPIAFIPSFMDFVLVYNTGAAFGLFEGGGAIFVGVAIISMLVILIYLFKAKQLRMLVVIALGLIAGGALGNAYDRATSGAVPDFFRTLFIDFPVFNVADIALTVGEFGLLIIIAIYWFGPSKQKDLEEPSEVIEEEIPCHPE
ncbi:MAG: signal peptidase II, partial [Coriobacteriia bacterium]|nr:signal peptidase II [Coriobacteriia bacterium]